MTFLQALLGRPKGMSLLSLATLVLGALAFQSLPVAPLPRIDFSTIVVSASLPGASPEVMASAVATPLERHLGRIAGLSELTSSSGQGSTTIVLQFALSEPIERAARAVQLGINAAEADLPANLPMRPTFRKMNPADAPMLVLALTADNVSLPALYAIAKAQVVERLAQIEGVGEVFVGGAQQPAVRLKLSLSALRARSLTLADVRTRLAAVNAHRPLGSIDGPNRSFAIRADDELLNAAAYRSLVLGGSAEQPVRLSDVGEAIDGVENDRSAAWFDGRRSILLFLRRQPAANVTATVDRVRSALGSLEQALPDGVHMEVAIDQSRTIRASIKEVELALVLSILLVVLVVGLFLHDLRASSIPCIAIPLSVAATFAAMSAIGYSLDNLSLMALTIASGFVVDDAIVVTEVIIKRIERGASPREAARAGLNDVAFTIVSITISLLAVFLPLLLLGGLVGRLFREFAVVLSLAVGFSAVISLTLTPGMCVAILRAEGARTGRRHGVVRALMAAEGLVQRGYARALRLALRKPRQMQLLVALTIALSVALFVESPKGMFPAQDSGLLFVTVQRTSDYASSALIGLHQQVLQALQSDPALSHSVGFVSDGSSGMAVVMLQQKGARKEPLSKTLRRLKERTRHIVGADVLFMPMQDLRVGGRRSPANFQYTLQSTDLAALTRAAAQVTHELEQLPEVRDVNSDQQPGAREVAAAFDRPLAAAFGLNVNAFDQALYDAFGQRQIGVLYDAISPRRVVIEALESQDATPDVVDSLYVGSAGALVPLTNVATLSRRLTPLSVNHQGQMPSVTLSFATANNVALGDAVGAVHRAVAGLRLPSVVQGEFAGTAQAFAATAKSMPWLIGAALLAVYIVLGVLYESYVHPLTILSTIPSAGLGALLALRLCGYEFGIMALIGVILLIGIVKKNAIMVVDFATQLRRQAGVSPKAAIEAACLARLRPILMTSAAALLGALPLAVGSGSGSELRRPLGAALVGGLCVSQLVTLFTIPVVYLGLEHAASWLAARRQGPSSSERPRRFGDN